MINGSLSESGARRGSEGEASSPTGVLVASSSYASKWCMCQGGKEGRGGGQLGIDDGDGGVVVIVAVLLLFC